MKGMHWAAAARDARRIWALLLGLGGIGVNAFGAGAPPFSFRYGGRGSDELLPRWERRSTATGETYRDPATALEIRLTRFLKKR